MNRSLRAEELLVALSELLPFEFGGNREQALILIESTLLESEEIGIRYVTLRLDERSERLRQTGNPHAVNAATHLQEIRRSLRLP